MGSLLVHMQLQNSFGFVMVYLRFPPTLSVQTAICITIPINIHRCQLIGKVIPITQWDQSHFGISLYFWDIIFKIQSKIENLYSVVFFIIITLNSWNNYFWLKNDGEKWSRFFLNFKTQRALLELLLPSAKIPATKGWIGLAG